MTRMARSPTISRATIGMQVGSIRLAFSRIHFRASSLWRRRSRREGESPDRPPRRPRSRCSPPFRLWKSLAKAQMVLSICGPVVFLSQLFFSSMRSDSTVRACSRSSMLIGRRSVIGIPGRRRGSGAPRGRRRPSVHRGEEAVPAGAGEEPDGQQQQVQRAPGKAGLQIFLPGSAVRPVDEEPLALDMFGGQGAQ